MILSGIPTVLVHPEAVDLSMSVVTTPMSVRASINTTAERITQVSSDANVQTLLQRDIRITMPKQRFTIILN